MGFKLFTSYMNVFIYQNQRLRSIIISSGNKLKMILYLFYFDLDLGVPLIIDFIPNTSSHLTLFDGIYFEPSRCNMSCVSLKYFSFLKFSGNSKQALLVTQSSEWMTTTSSFAILSNTLTPVFGIKPIRCRVQHFYPTGMIVKLIQPSISIVTKVTGMYMFRSNVCC